MVKTLSVASLLLLSILMLVPLAHATPPTAVSGTGTTTIFTVTSTRFANGNTIITADITVVDTGGISGTLVGTERDVIHADGSDEFDGSGTFTGTVLGSPTGTASISFSGVAFFTSTGDISFAEGHETITHGTSGLAGVHGEITFHTTSTICAVCLFVVVYSGQAHFDPS